MKIKTFKPLGGGVHQLINTQNKPSMNLQLFADSSTTILTSTTNPMEGWIKGDIHCFVTNENNFLLVRLLSLLNNSMKVWDITYNTDGGISAFKCLDGNGTCTYDSNNLLTDIKILDGNDSILDEVQLEYDPVTKFISSYKKSKYNCDGKTIISSLDPNYKNKSLLDTNIQTILDSECYIFSSMNNMFDGCSSLTTLDVSKWDTSSVTDMSSMFYGCNALTNLDVSKWDTSKVTSMGYMFSGCNVLTSLDVSNWDTSNVSDMRYMFYGCNKLITLDVSKWDTSNVTDMSDMFNGCYELKTLDISNWDTSKVTDMSYMFDKCNSLTELDVSKWNTSKVTNMHNMFNDCYKLTTITGVIDMKSCTSYDNMFNGCDNLTGVKIKNPPSGFTNDYASEISSGKIVIVQ